ncbi:MAG: PAS domain-containing protein [Proteobacteria bacterium]|nr:PAS domain-containing protein [Pseudomonadota bacterium]
MSVKGKLLLIAAIALAALAMVFGVNLVGGNYRLDAEHADEVALGAKVALLEARRAEKDFYDRREDDYVEKVKHFVVELGDNVRKAQELEPVFTTLATEIKVKAGEYEKNFLITAAAQKTMGYTRDDGLRGRLRGAARQLEARVEGLNLAGDDLLLKLLMLRRHEKNFIINHEDEHLVAFKSAMAELRRSIESSALRGAGNETRVMLALADEYSQAFEACAQQDQLLRATKNKVSASAHALMPLVQELELGLGTLAEEVNSRIGITSVTVGICMAILLIVLVTLTIRSIIVPLTRLQAYARQVAGGDFSEVSAQGFSGELKSLHEDISAMVCELKIKLGFAQGVLKSIPISCLTTDREDKLTFANQQILELAGRSGAPKEFLGWNHARFMYDNNAETMTQRAMVRGETLDQECTFTNLAGAEVVANIVASPIADLDGELIGSVTLCVDLTEVRKQQQAMERANKIIAAAAIDATAISDQMASASEELSAQVEQSSKGSNEQRAKASETATAMEQMNASVLEVAHNASDAANAAERTRETAATGSVVVAEVVDGVQGVYTNFQKVHGTMQNLCSQSDGISDIVQVIEDIADQTNLLALNAAIEAARAGDAGRGFAVVADEVRKLAEKTMTATKEVSGAVQSIQKAAQETILGMGEAGKVIEGITAKSKEAGTSLGSILKMVEETSFQVQSIASAAEEQSAASEQVTQATDEINQIAIETADAMEQSSQAVTDLARLAQDLKKIIAGMQV